MEAHEIEWEPDENVLRCPLCHTDFTFFYRRHHCRRCGKVVCGSCSKTRTLYPAGDLVATAPHHMFQESENTRHRTCDLCIEELILIQGDVEREGSSADLQSLPMRVPLSSRYVKDITVQRTRVVVPDRDSESACPICGDSLSGRTERGREEHVSACLIKAEFSGSPAQTRTSNRMLVYDIPYPEKKPIIVSCSDSTLAESPLNSEKHYDYEECVICLEEIVPGNKVGRLECLCVFHYKCIKNWFKRKGVGSCPVHYMSAYD